MKIDEALKKARDRLSVLQAKSSCTRHEYFEETRLERRIEKLERQKKRGEGGKATLA